MAARSASGSATLDQQPQRRDEPALQAAGERAITPRTLNLPFQLRVELFGLVIESDLRFQLILKRPVACFLADRADLRIVPVALFMTASASRSQLVLS